MLDLPVLPRPVNSLQNDANFDRKPQQTGPPELERTTLALQGK